MTDYIEVPKPHGFLLWRNKQTAIASDKQLSTGIPLTVVSGNEAYGMATLEPPAIVNVSEFDRLSDVHCTWPEERKLYWPEAQQLYVHRLREWEPFESAKSISLEEDGLKFIEISANGKQQKIIEQAEKLPKHITLVEDVVTLDGNKAVIRDGIDKSKVEPWLNAVLPPPVLGELGLLDDSVLPLYQLALVRKPKLSLQEKKSGHKMMDEGDYYTNGPISFSELQAIKVAEMAAWEVNEMANQFPQMARRIMNRMDIEDKEAALAALATEFIDMSQAALSQEMSEKSFDPDMQSFSEWVDDYYKMIDGEIEGTKAVWSTAFVNNLPNSSFMYITPNCGENDEGGKTKPRSCRKFPIKDASGKVDLPHLRNAIARIPQADIPDSEKIKLQAKARRMLEMENKSGPGLMDRVKDAWQTVKDFVSVAQEPELSETHFAIKQVNGQPWLVTYSTNAFEDREREIFSTKSLEKYVEVAEKENNRGFFNLWHIKNSDFAEIKWQGVAGRVLVEAGPFLDNELGQAACKFFKQYPSGHPVIAPEGWGCSPEYRYLPEERKSGVYENIWKTRTSVLSRMAAANIWTKGDIKMALTKEQIKSAEEIFGADLAKQIIGGAEETTKTLEEANVNHKSVEEEKLEEKPQLTLDAIADVLAQRFSANISPLAETVTNLQKQVETLQGELKSYKKTEEAAKQAELPKYVFSLTRASGASESVVAEDDKLLDQKPTESRPKDNSGAANFFPATR